MSSLKITVQWTDRNGKEWTAGYSPGWISGFEQDRELTLLKIQAGFKAIYKSILEKLNYSEGEIIGLMNTQMRDCSKKDQEIAMQLGKEFMKKINKMKLQNATIKPIKYV